MLTFTNSTGALLRLTEQGRHLADVVHRLEDSAQVAQGLHHRSKYLLLVNDFLRRLVDLHRELVDDVERELSR